MSKRGRLPTVLGVGVVRAAVVGTAVIVGAGPLVAGCGSDDHPAAGPASTSALAVSAPGIALARCAALDDVDIDRATGLSGLRLVAANPLRCSWTAQSGGDYTVVFQWFRGSPLVERRAQVTIGPVTDVRVAGHTGYQWSGDRSCEIAVDSGGGDFIDWFVRVPDGGTAPCAALPALAAGTFAKAG